MDSSFLFTKSNYIGNKEADWPCVASCTSTKILNKSCVSACPTGFQVVGSTCTECATGLFSNGTTCTATCPNFSYLNQCFTTCPTFTKPNGTTCVLCFKNIVLDSNVTQYYLPIPSTTTYSICPGDDTICTLFNLIAMVSSQNVCTTCLQKNASAPYFDELTMACIADGTCPTGYAKSVTNLTCIKCTNIPAYKSLTHTNKIVIDFNYCPFCETTNIYMLNFDGNCLASCPTNYTFTSEKNCICTLYLDGLNCVTVCPGNLGVNSSNICVNCKNEPTTQFNYNHICVDPQPDFTTIINNVFNVVVNCIDAVPSMKIYNLQCVDTCPSLTAIYENGNECFAWKPISKFMMNNLIVSVCPENYTFLELNSYN